MEYRLLLNGRRIDRVVDVKELIKRDVKQYISIAGGAFCEDRGAALKFWQVKAEFAYKGSESLLEDLRAMGKSGEPLLLSVSSDIGSFSSRVILQEMDTAFINSEACGITLGLLEYVKPAVNVTASSRPGTDPESSALTTAGDAYKLIEKYGRGDNNVNVKNPLTGAEIENIAAIDSGTVVKVEKIG